MLPNDALRLRPEGAAITAAGTPFSGADLWPAVDRLLGGMSVHDVRVHDVRPLAARRWRELGREIPPDFAHEERATRAAMMILPTLLKRAREAFDGRILLFKGPEVTAVYPGAARSFNDLDLLVDDAQTAQQALVGAGFIEVPDPTDHYLGIHHLAPLVWPELPLKIEIHELPKWPTGVPPPSREELFEAAVPSFSGVDGVEAPAPHHHSLLLLAHGWAHTPLGSLRDLVDVAAIATDAAEDELARAARSWGLDRIWATTERAAQWLFFGEGRPVAVSLWARHLITLREATVLEAHVERWLSPFWMLPAREALPVAARQVLRDFNREAEGTWSAKGGSLARALRHAFVAKSEHGWVDEDAPPPVDLPRPRRR